MTTPPKPAAKKPVARKKPAGPTKAAALKALGLTKEDLDIIAMVNEARERAAAEIQHPEDLQYEEPVAPAAHTAAAPVLKTPPAERPTVEPGFFARNLRNVEANIRLARQEKGKKRIELKPRGFRGDLFRLKPEDLEDENLLANIGLLVEIITAAEAKSIIEKQTTNLQTAIHPSMAILRNELGEEYAEGALKVDAEYNSQGITVAHLKPQGGGAGEIQVDRQGIHRAPTNAAPGGNSAIISDGFNASAAQADAIARRKDLEGPAAGLPGMKVTMAEVERT